MGQATVGDGEVRYGDGRVDGISGTAAYAMAADGTRIVRTALAFQGVDAFGQALEPGRVSLELDGDLLRANADLVAPGVRATLTAVGSVRDLDQPVALSATGTADVAWLLVLLPLLPDAAGAAGELDFTLTGRVAEPLQVAQAKDRLAAALVSRLTLDGTVGVQLRAAVRLRGALDPGRLAGLPEPLRAMLGGGVLQVQIGGADATPLGLRIGQAEDGVAVAVTTGPSLIPRCRASCTGGMRSQCARTYRSRAATAVRIPGCPGGSTGTPHAASLRAAQGATRSRAGPPCWLPGQPPPCHSGGSILHADRGSNFKAD